MSLQKSWDKAVRQYVKAGGTKMVPVSFWSACGAVDAAHTAFHTAKAGSTASEKALKKFKKAELTLRTKMKPLVMEVGFEGPAKALVDTANLILKAASDELRKAEKKFAKDGAKKNKSDTSSAEELEL